MNEIKVKVGSAREQLLGEGTIVGTLAPQTINGLPVIAAQVNNEVVSLTYPLAVNCDVKFLTMESSYGWRVYRRSLTFLLTKVMRTMFPSATFSVEHSFGVGLYCSFQENGEGGISAENLAKVEREMRRLVTEDLPIERKKIAYVEALKSFKDAGQLDTASLLEHRNPPYVVVYYCGGFRDLAHGPLAPCTGLLDRFQLIHYPPGFVLHLPDRTAPHEIPPFDDQPHLLQIFQEHKEWGRILGVNTAGKLNDLIANREIEDFIRVNEALHEKKLASIADMISKERERVKIVLIAGPSSSGKTTFAKRLCVHLAGNGIKPVTISTDDYFVGHERNPVDETGKPDFEHIEAVDLKLFNSDLSNLVSGRKVRMPRFDFAQKVRVDSGKDLQINSDQIIIIEGIHGLNPRLTSEISTDRKFKIYISALTQLSVDAGNRISTTDNRLMRRIVRDHRYRGHSALYTLQLWQSVRRGEKRWIFPFQKEADATFNSALDYELAVLKAYVDPLLMQVKPDQPEYAEARRLAGFLLNFLVISPRDVPSTSILREYIGGSSFRY